MTDNICLNFVETIKKNPTKTSIKYKKKGRWRSIQWQEYGDIVTRLAFQLHLLGLSKGDRLAIISETRFEWAAMDLACLALGGVTVPIYASNSAEDMEFILNNSGAKILVVENKFIANKILQIHDKCTNLKSLICIDDVDNPHFVRFRQLISQENPSSYNLQELASQISPEDTASIVYTSGTTGKPKGVVLCHKHILSEIHDVFNEMPVSSDDCSLSFLPFSHIFGRCEHWGHVYTGFTMAYAESVENLRSNLQEIKPSFLVAVPRIFEKIYNSVISAAESSPIRNKLFLWALDIGKRISWYKQRKEPIPVKLIIEYKLANKLVFSKLQERLGGRIRFAISGGAPLNAEIAEFFHAAGLLILEGYGLTETTAAVFLNTSLHYKFGSVGKPLGDTEFKFLDDGELLVKSSKVMKEYYQAEEATAEVLKDKWFSTGDVGYIDSEGYLVITDRKKDLIKTAGGKYVAPQKIEKLLKLNKYISNVLVHGDKRKYIVCLFCLEIEEIKSFAKNQGIATDNFKELVDKNEVYQLIRNLVADVNSQLASYETIKAFHILDHDFSEAGGQLTPSLKVKRKHCDNLYEKEISQLYGNEASDKVRY